MGLNSAETAAIEVESPPNIDLGWTTEEEPN